MPGQFRRLKLEWKDWTPADIDADETTALFTVKAGTRVVGASAMLLTAADASTNSTAELGDGTDPNGYVTSASGSGNLDLEASTVGTFLQGTGAYLDGSFGKLYAADDTVDVTYTNGTQGTTKPVVRFRIWTLQDY